MRRYNGGGQQHQEGGGLTGGEVGGTRRWGPWLFPEIGLAATLHLHGGDRREGSEGEGSFSLGILLETTQQVNSCFTVAAPGKVSGR